MRQFHILVFLAFLFLSNANGQAIKEKQSLKIFFDEHEVTGSFLLFDPQENAFISYNYQRCLQGFIPASTYKIMNSLIGLETKVLSGESHVIPWNGQPSWNKEWEKDHTLASAFKVSCVPYYQELARRIGAANMEAMVTKAGYGNMDITEENIDRFWLEGKSRISQKQQVEFLRNLYFQEGLPFSSKNLDIVKKIMLLDQNEQYILKGKTGFGRQDGNYIGWLVGYVEVKNKVYFYATNFEKKEEELNASEGFNAIYDARRDITLKIFRELGII